MNTRKSLEWRSNPSRTHRFFIYDPEGEGYMWFTSAAARDAAAPDVIREYLDDGWSEEVSLVCAGELTAATEKTDIKLRPERDWFETEEEFEDAMEEWPNSDFDTICNHELRPIAVQE